MLLDKFFKITSTDIADNKAKVAIKLDPTHKIYEGHFPGLPIVPGVCMLQILKETLETIVSAKIRLRKADQMKFLIVIDPLKVVDLDLNINFKIDEDDQLNVSAELLKGSDIYFKFKGGFVFE